MRNYKWIVLNKVPNWAVPGFWLGKYSILHVKYKELITSNWLNW